MNQINKIIIEGIAENAKAGAVVVAEDRETYYIEGLPYWNSRYLNKKISVTGYLIEIQSTESRDSAIISQSRPAMKVTRDAKYKIIR